MVYSNKTETENLGSSQVRVCEIVRVSGSCGFNLTKSKWDPYPWVSNVESGSPADAAGVQAGDCLLEVNGEDVIGLRVVEVANRVKAGDEKVTVMLWNSGVDSNCSPETLCCGPMPTNLQRLSICMNNILAALECPVCLETIPPPAHQCANGHLICLKCRVKTDKCPVCRLKIFRGRSLLADQVYNSLIDTFDVKDKEESQRRKMLKFKILGHRSESSKSKQNLKNFNPPTNKFLSRLLKSRKSSSAENLTESSSFDNNSNMLKPSDGFNVDLKAKSLSSSEIFKYDSQPVSRASSNFSTKPESNLLDIQTVSHLKRPASCYGSVEELHKGTAAEDSLYHSNQKCHCLYNPISQKLKYLLSPHPFNYLQNLIEGPVLHFFKPEIELKLPLPYDNSTLLTLTFRDVIFVIKILDYSCKNNENYIWVWSLNSKQNNFVASITIQDNSIINFEYPITSFETNRWEQLINPSNGISLNIKKGSVKVELKNI